MRTEYHDPKDARGRVGIRAGAALAFLFGCATVVGVLLSSSSAGAAQLHGISFLKGCQSPTLVGQPYICSFQAQNVVDQASDTLTITSVVDVVHAGSGNVTSGNLLPGASITFTGGASCNGGQTLCTLPFGASITFTTSHYTVQANDPNPLTDTATLTWQDTCSSGSANCPSGDQTFSSGSQSALQTPTFTPTATSTGTTTPSATPTLTPTNTREATNTPRRDDTDTPVAPTVTPFSQVSPAAVSPTPRSTPTAFHQALAQALPASGSGNPGGPTGGSAAAAIACVLGGITLLESLRLTRNRR